MWREQILSVALAASIAGVGQSPGAAAPQPGSAAEVTAFAGALDACAEGAVATPHPLMRGFIVQHTIGGQSGEVCAYTQSMPGGMRMECAFSAAGRAAMAAEIRAMASGAVQGGGTNRAQPAWSRECEIVTASGSRSPMVQPARRPR